MLLFGGSAYDIYRQISAVKSCGLKRIGDLPNKLNQGACNTFYNASNSSYALLCFDYSSYKDGCLR